MLAVHLEAVLAPAILRVMRSLPDLNPDDVDELEQLIRQEKKTLRALRVYRNEPLAQSKLSIGVVRIQIHTLQVEAAFF